MGKTIALDGRWQFALDPENRGMRKAYFSAPLEEAEDVFIPHTFNCGNGTDTYRGAAWYQYALDIPAEWSDKRIQVRFDGVYRDADLWLNGEKAGKHYGAGFTTFRIELTGAVRAGGENLLTVRTDNSYSPYALPWQDQFDWADDGGIFRPAYLEVSDRTSIDRVLVDALPVIARADGRKNEGPAELGLRITMSSDADSAAEITCELLDGAAVVASGMAAGRTEETRGSQDREAGACGMQGGEAEIAVTIPVEHVKYWHFDAPRLYTLKLTVTSGGKVTDVWEKRVGFRVFATEGNEFVLNGEKIHTVGTEWMPGSDPRIGNAERPEDLARVLAQLKGTNCIYTRVHWQQDDSFYDWCDEHGMMVQEEIPLWGSPKEPVTDTTEMAKAQFREMAESHYDHPSIVSWGVGNELNGQSEVTKQYVTDMVSFIRTIDAYRPVSYVSNTAWESPDDACSRSDIMMCNDYIGTWHQGFDNEEAVRAMCAVHGDKPMFISEFGLCEPAFAGGDTRRERIFLDKIDLYRRNNVAGFIYFCLNDYRTQMGEDGEGRFRRRVHGSTDFYGNPKPSFSAVTRECAPVKIGSVTEDPSDGSVTAELEARNDLPRYRVEGYYLEVRETGKAPRFAAVPDMDPGATASVTLKAAAAGAPKAAPEGTAEVEMQRPVPGRGGKRILAVHRPNGDEVLRIEL